MSCDFASGVPDLTDDALVEGGDRVADNGLSPVNYVFKMPSMLTTYSSSSSSRFRVVLLGSDTSHISRVWIRVMITIHLDLESSCVDLPTSRFMRAPTQSAITRDKSNAYQRSGQDGVKVETDASWFLVTVEPQ